MRTTITIDPDVESLIRLAMKERGLSFKDAVNSAIRAGLSQRKPGKAFVQRTFSMGSEQNFLWDKALATADAMEDEELARKLSLRK